MNAFEFTDLNSREEHRGERRRSVAVKENTSDTANSISTAIHNDSEMSSQSQDFAYGTGSIAPQFDNNDQKQQQHPKSAGDSKPGSSKAGDRQEQTTKNSGSGIPLTTVINVSHHQETGYNVDRKHVFIITFTKQKNHSFNITLLKKLKVNHDCFNCKFISRGVLFFRKRQAKNAI